MLETLLPWAGVAALVGFGILLLYCILLHTRLQRMKKKYDFFMHGEDGGSLERKLSVEVTELREATRAMELIFQQQAAIKKVQGDTFQKIGFVKYNAFDNIGNDLSFAITLLDGNNNGVCLSSVYGRNESRVFSKPIVNGKSVITLSQEELASLNEALSNKTNQEALVSASV